MEAAREVDMIRRLETWLEDEFTKSLWLCDVPNFMQKTIVIVTN